MKSLVIDVADQSWQDSRGFRLADNERPVLDEEHNPSDAAAVIIKLKYAGVCGTDRGLWYRAAFKDQLLSSLAAEGRTSRVVGHEFIGEIVEAGSMVGALYSDPDPKNPDKLEVGNLVTGDSHVTCGRCYQCRMGEANVCANEAILGITIDGVFSEYAKLPAKNLWAINTERIRPEVGAIMDPFGNAIHALTRVDVRGQRVAIFGCGPIGLFALLIAQNFGAGRVIMADVSEEHLKMAQALGADATVLIKPGEKADPWQSDDEALAEIRELTHGRGVDVALEMAGPASSINNAIKATRRGGQVVLFGIKDGDLTIPQFSSDVIVRGLTLHGVIGRQIFRTWQVSQRLLAQSSNGIQDKIWQVILNSGEGSVLDFKQFEPDSFERQMNEQVKLIFKMD